MGAYLRHGGDGDNLSTGEAGYIKLDTASLFSIYAIVAGLLLTMAFWNNVLEEALGGVLGGLAVVVAPSLIAKYRWFSIRHMPVDQRITREGMKDGTALRMASGNARTWVALRPRKGVHIHRIDIAFFEHGVLPWGAGRPKNASVCVRSVKRYRPDLASRDQWEDCHATVNDETTFFNPSWLLSENSRTILEIEIEIGEGIREWVGQISYQIDCSYGDIPAPKKNVRAKFLVLPENKRRPLSAIGKRITLCQPIPIRGKAGRNDVA